MQLKKYKKEFAHSYALGPFPTFELLQNAPHQVLEVHAAPGFRDLQKLESLCKKHGVPFFVGDKVLLKISDKEICYAAGVFQKYSAPLSEAGPHVVLHNPADMGNLGTILRTLLGFGIKNLAIIEPAADLFHPKVVRASMGAMFHMNVERFPDFDAYRQRYGAGRDLFPFMLNGKKALQLSDCPKSTKYTLIFGNEARGLPEEFGEYGASILIPHSPEVDSLNLAVSVAVGSFVFTTVNQN